MKSLCNLAVLLEHCYTQANMSFNSLKGRDSMIERALRMTGESDLALALAERKDFRESTLVEEALDDFHFAQGSTQTRKQMHLRIACELRMEIMHESSVSYVKVVADKGSDFSKSKLHIDFKKEMLDGYPLFKRKPNAIPDAGD